MFCESQFYFILFRFHNKKIYENDDVIFFLESVLDRAWRPDPNTTTIKNSHLGPVDMVFSTSLPFLYEFCAYRWIEIWITFSALIFHNIDADTSCTVSLSSL